MLLISLEDFKLQIRNLAAAKGWQDSQLWLERCMFVELGELLKAVEDGKSQEDIAEEFADVMHFLLQYLHREAPLTNLDLALQKKIDSNWNNKKKTWDDEKGIVRK